MKTTNKKSSTKKYTLLEIKEGTTDNQANNLGMLDVGKHANMRIKFPKIKENFGNHKKYEKRRVVHDML